MGDHDQKLWSHRDRNENSVPFSNRRGTCLCFDALANSPPSLGNSRPRLSLVHLTCEQVTGSGSTPRARCLKDEIALVFFAEQHARELGGVERVRTDLYCRHYGKSRSVEHWEETCDYYVRDRKGRAIHTQSDFFMRPLFEWGGTLFANAVQI